MLIKASRFKNLPEFPACEEQGGKLTLIWRECWSGRKLRAPAERLNTQPEVQQITVEPRSESRSDPATDSPEGGVEGADLRGWEPSTCRHLLAPPPHLSAPSGTPSPQPTAGCSAPQGHPGSSAGPCVPSSGEDSAPAHSEPSHAAAQRRE